MPESNTRRLFTVDEWYRMAEVGILRPDERAELIRGVVMKWHPIGPRHGASVDHANRVFVRCTGDNAIVRVQGVTVLDKYSAPIPDLVVLRPRADFYAKKNPGPADVLLIIEVADSSLEYDTTVKVALYAIMGIPEYWVADLQNNRVICYSDPIKDKDAYHSVHEFRHGEIITPKLVPACRLDVEVLLPL